MRGYLTRELIRLRETLRRQTSRFRTITNPFRQLGFCNRPGPSGCILPGLSIGHREGPNIGHAAIFIFLKPHAFAARHLDHLRDREAQ